MCSQLDRLVTMHKLIALIVALHLHCSTVAAQNSTAAQATDFPENARSQEQLLKVAITIPVMAVLLIVAAVMSSVTTYCCMKRWQQTRESRRIKLTNHEEIELNNAFGNTHSRSRVTGDATELIESTTNQAYAALPVDSVQSKWYTHSTDDGYTNITDTLLIRARQPTLTNGSPASQHRGYLASQYERDPFSEGHYEAEGNVEDKGSHECQFWEPATLREELLCQIANINMKMIPICEIELLKVLGRGQFGTVHVGSWEFKEDEVSMYSQVAVKIMTAGATEEDKVKFLQEAAIMGQFKHSNILAIKGIIIDGDMLGIVTDLMHKGDLHRHLGTLKDCGYNNCELNQLLISFSRQIAYGLCYLHYKSYVHRDLAARNILLTNDCICKIADFGLSRDLQNDGYYRSHGGKIPVKWTAPEAINYRKYSSSSDMWSYGCVLYEIWSLGEKPFSQLTNLEAIQVVSSGYRLPPPPGCLRLFYEIMIQCWHPNPKSRPAANDVMIMLQKPDFKYKWTDNEISRYSEEARTLGSGLENGHPLYQDLQQIYSSSIKMLDRPVRQSEESSLAYSYETPIDAQ